MESTVDARIVLWRSMVVVDPQGSRLESTTTKMTTIRKEGDE